MKGIARISTEIWIAFAAFLCFAIIAFLDYSNQQRAVERFDTFSSYDYQPGGYHAWYDLLQREGVRVQRFQRRPAYINDAVSTLVVANNANDALLRMQNSQPAGFFARGDYDALARWIKNGGHLLWLADAGAQIGQTGAAVAALSGGVDPENKLHLPALTQSALKKDEAIAVAASSFTAGVHAVSGRSPVRIPLANSAGVVPLIADDTGATVAIYPLGKGEVIVASDETLFQNSRLGLSDNARLAYNLAAAPAGSKGVVAFEEWSHGYQSGDTWWTILPKPMQWAFLILCAGFALALAGSAIRFGPAVRLPDRSERTSEEYLQSMAQLMRRARASRKAVRDLAQLGHHEVAQALGLPDATPASLLATRLRGSERGDRIADALIELDRLAGYEQPSSAELIRAAALCFTLRKEYASHGDWRRRYRRTAQRRTA